GGHGGVGAGHAHPGVVHQNVQGSVGPLNLGRHGVHLGPVGDVEPVGGVGGPAGRSRRSRAFDGGLLGGGLVDVGAQDGGSLGGQRQRGGPADAAPGP